MGGSASKAARTSAGAAKRVYPTRVPPTTEPAIHPAEPMSASHDAHARSDAGANAQPHSHTQAQALDEAQAQAPAAAHAYANPGPTVHPAPYASGTRDSAIAADGFDPQLAASLRQLGPVMATPTHSNSSVGPETTPPPWRGDAPSATAPIFPTPAINPALLVLEARRRLAEEAEHEMERLGKPGFAGKAFVDVMLLRRALALRDERGWAPDRIERELSLHPGTVQKLGSKGIVSDAGGGMESVVG